MSVGYSYTIGNIFKKIALRVMSQDFSRSNCEPKIVASTHDDARLPAVADTQIKLVRVSRGSCVNDEPNTRIH